MAGSCAGRPATLIVEPNPGGHRLEAVSHVVRRVAADGGRSVLLTSHGTSGSAEFRVQLDGLALPVDECFTSPTPHGAELARRIAAGCREHHADTVVVMDGDLALTTWWWHGARQLRGLPHRPRVRYFLTRYPARPGPTDLRHWRLRMAKATLVALARLTGAIDRAAGFAGRDERHRGWLVTRAIDPAICSAHSADRSRLRAELGLPTDRLLVGIFGGINVRKDPPLVLAAVRASGLPADLLMAGPVDEGIRRWLAQLPAGQRERVLVADDFHPNDRLDRYLACADVVALMMTLEGPSGIQGKALAAGVPVVSAGSRTRARELAATGGGVATRPDAAAVATALRTLLAGATTPARAMPTAPRSDLPTGDTFAAAILGSDRPHSPPRRRSHSDDGGFGSSATGT